MLTIDEIQELEKEVTAMLKPRYGLDFIYVATVEVICFDLIDLDYSDDVTRAEVNTYYVRADLNAQYHEALNTLFLEAEKIINWYEGYTEEQQEMIRG